MCWTQIILIWSFLFFARVFFLYFHTKIFLSFFSYIHRTVKIAVFFYAASFFSFYIIWMCWLQTQLQSFLLISIFHWKMYELLLIASEESKNVCRWILEHIKNINPWPISMNGYFWRRKRVYLFCNWKMCLKATNLCKLLKDLRNIFILHSSAINLLTKICFYYWSSFTIF